MKLMYICILIGRTRVYKLERIELKPILKNKLLMSLMSWGLSLCIFPLTDYDFYE